MCSILGNLSSLLTTEANEGVGGYGGTSGAQAHLALCSAGQPRSSRSTQLQKRESAIIKPGNSLPGQVWQDCSHVTSRNWALGHQIALY